MNDHRDLSGTQSWFAHNQSWGNPRHYWESFLCSTEQETDDGMRFPGRPGHIPLGFSAPRAKKMPVDLRLTKWSESCSVMSDSLRPHGLYSPWNSPGQNTGVGSCSLLQGIFPPRDRTQVSHTAGGFFTSWATREAQTTLLNKRQNHSVS